MVSCKGGRVVSKRATCAAAVVAAATAATGAAAAPYSGLTGYGW